MRMARKKLSSPEQPTDNKTGTEEKPLFTQVRIDEDTFLKGKILAAIMDLSFNSLMVRAIRNEIKKYEAEHGELPKPIKSEE